MQNLSPTTATAYGSVLVGLEAQVVTITATAISYLDALHISGLPEVAARETRVRLSAVARPLNVRVKVLDLPEGASTSSLDLAIAAAILRALGQPVQAKLDAIFVGELGLDGKVKPVSGILCRINTSRQFVVSYANREEAGLVPEAECYAINHVHDLTGPVGLQQVQPWQLPESCASRSEAQLDDLSEPLKALYQACVGHTRILLTGRHGSGKTMLARVIATNLGLLSSNERLEVAKIYSACGLFEGLSAQRPFRAPHHTVSEAGLLGNGRRPGEISLAHRGVLLLDEIIEYPLPRLRALSVTLSGTTIKFPAVPAAIIATATPCPCGYLNSKTHHTCRCTEATVQRYQKRLTEITDLFGLHQVDL